MAASFTSVHVGSLRPLRQAKATEVTPGKDYDLEGYGTMFGLHTGSDEGRFSYVELGGDFDVTVRIESIHNDEAAFTEAGLMARASLHPSALMVAQAVTTNEYVDDADQYTFMRRTKYAGFLFDSDPAEFAPRVFGNDAFSYQAQGYQPKNADGVQRPFPDVHLRLTRTGDDYVGMRRERDEDWIEIGRTTLDLGPTPLVGMFISANHHSASAVVGNPTARAIVHFRDLTGVTPA